MVKCSSIVLLTALAFAKARVPYWNTANKLQPVHGLYVKPSADGSIGDLYVAATEDNGVKSQWLTDQPVGFLPTTAAAHQPVAYNPSIGVADDAINPQKRAVINAPLQYAYAYPVPSHAEGSSLVPYPFTLPTHSSAPTNTETLAPRSPDAAVVASMSQYQPLQYFYPQMMSAYADLLNAFKESAGAATDAAESNDESNSTLTPQTAPAWPYTYPVQYVMVDPSMWAQSQAAAISATPPTSTTPSSTVVLSADNE